MPKPPLSAELTNRYPLRRGGPLTQLRELASNLQRYAFLVNQLVRVNLRAGVRRSFIGLSWLVILPLFSVAVWVLLNRAGIVDPGQTDIPYPAFVLLSTSIWGFFAELAKSMSRMLENNGRTLTQTPFPAEVLIAENIVVHLIKFSIPFALNVIVLLAFGVRFSVVALLFPLTLLPLLLLGTAVGLIMSMIWREKYLSRCFSRGSMSSTSSTACANASAFIMYCCLTKLK
jgi:lipopolysaccharide transport system permease protein